MLLEQYRSGHWFYKPFLCHGFAFGLPFAVHPRDVISPVSGWHCIGYDNFSAKWLNLDRSFWVWWAVQKTFLNTRHVFRWEGRDVEPQEVILVSMLASSHWGISESLGLWKAKHESPFASARVLHQSNHIFNGYNMNYWFKMLFN